MSGGRSFVLFAVTGVNTPLNAMFEHTKRLDWERRGEQLPCKIRELIKSNAPSRVGCVIKLEG